MLSYFFSFKINIKTIKADLKVLNMPFYSYEFVIVFLYNFIMENCISFLIIVFVLDFLITLSQKKLFGLKIKNLHILFLQILNISVAVMYVFCGLKFYQFLLMKLIVNFLICLLITDNYNALDIVKIYLSYLLFLFSIYGFAVFMMEFAKAVIYELFNVKIAEIYNIFVFFGVLIFILLIVYLSQNLHKDSNLKNFLFEVSFSFFDKHIKITGLLDSGNMLYDTKTGKAVIVVSTSVMKKFLPKDDYMRLVDGDYKYFNYSNSISYVSVGGVSSEMPIFDVGSVDIMSNQKCVKRQCVIGFVNQEFDSKRYQCLLHRDFV